MSEQPEQVTDRQPRKTATLIRTAAAAATFGLAIAAMQGVALAGPGCGF